MSAGWPLRVLRKLVASDCFFCVQLGEPLPLESVVLSSASAVRPGAPLRLWSTSGKIPAGGRGRAVATADEDYRITQLADLLSQRLQQPVDSQSDPVVVRDICILSCKPSLIGETQSLALMGTPVTFGVCESTGHTSSCAVSAGVSNLRRYSGLGRVRAQWGPLLQQVFCRSGQTDMPWPSLTSSRRQTDRLGCEPNRYITFVAGGIWTYMRGMASCVGLPDGPIEGQLMRLNARGHTCSGRSAVGGHVSLCGRARVSWVRKSVTVRSFGRLTSDSQ